MFDFSSCCCVTDIFASLCVCYVLFQVFLFFTTDSDHVTARSKENSEFYKNKVIWVTGASSGIGLSFVEHVANLGVGAKFILSARSKDKLIALQNSLKSKNTVSKVVVCDLSNIDKLPVVATEALNAFGGKIDILVNNAGLTLRSLGRDTDFLVDQEIVNVDLLACIGLTKLCLPAMRENRFGLFGFWAPCAAPHHGTSLGHIVNVSSIAGLMGTPLRTAYSAAKFGLIGFGDCLRLEESIDGYVGVTNICPGSVSTDVSKNAMTADGSKLGYTDPTIANGMKVERCAELMSIAISNQIGECWIIESKLQKLAVYTRQYCPSLHHWLMKRQAANIVSQTLNQPN